MSSASGGMRTVTEPFTLPLGSFSLLTVATNAPLMPVTSLVTVASEASNESTSNSMSPERMTMRRAGSGSVAGG